MMTSMAPSSSWFFFLLDVASLATLASAATFTVRNNCGFTVWPAAIPVGGGTQLNPGWTWTFDAPRGTSGRVWGRSGCSFNGWWGHCSSGDCGGAYSCSLSGQPPATLAEFSISRGGAAHDYYDISVVDGYNLPMDFSCSSGAGLRCRGSGCPDAYLYPTDDSKTHACDGNSNYTRSPSAHDRWGQCYASRIRMRAAACHA